jgi:hypothetical protein
MKELQEVVKGKVVMAGKRRKTRSMSRLNAFSCIVHPYPPWDALRKRGLDSNLTAVLTSHILRRNGLTQLFPTGGQSFLLN